MSLAQSEVIAWLRAVSDKRFFEVLYEAAEGRGADAHDSQWLEKHVVLGRAFREISEPPATWSIELVGLPVAPDVCADDSVIAQEGTHCGVAVVSCAKEFKCPVCGAVTHGT